MKDIRRCLYRCKALLCVILICALILPQVPLLHAVAQEDQVKTQILVEGENYTSVNFQLYDYEKDPGLSGGDFLQMKAPAGAVPPEEGFLASYSFEASEAGTYDLDMVCLAINGNLGSTIEVKLNDGEFKPYSEENTVNHGGVDGQVYRKNFFHYTLDSVPLRSGFNTVTIRIAAPRSTDNRYYFFLDYMKFIKQEEIENEGDIVLEGEHFADKNFQIPSYEKDPSLSNGDFLCLKSYPDNPIPEEGYQVSYQVTAKKASAYDMKIVCLSLDGNNGSVFQMKVNDGEFVSYNKNNAQLLGIVDSSIYRNSFMSYKLPPVVLQEGENTITVKVTEPRASDSRQYFYLDCIRFTPIEWNIKSIQPVDATVGVYEAGEDVSLKVDYYSAASGTEKIAYRIVDYWEKEVASGLVQTHDGEESMVITVPDIPKGHFMVYASVASGNISKGDAILEKVCQFSVVTPLSQRQKPSESPFALDAAMLMTYYKMPGFQIETALEYADALALSGVDTVRERYRWNDVTNMEQGKYNFDAFQTDVYYNRLKEHGIEILNMYDSAPDWAKHNKDDRLVADLRDLYRFSKDSALHYDGVVNAWEMANEPELTNTKNYETADRLAAYIKAAAIGYQDSGANPLLSIPGLAYTPQYYADLLLQNDVLKYVDIYNYHNHVALDQEADITYPSRIYQAHQKLLDQYDGQDKEMWLSEAGTYVDLPEGGEELTHEQQVKMSRYLVVSTLMSLAEGTDKHFYFNLTYLVERDRELGIFGLYDTPYAPYSAQAAMTETFGEADYQGELVDCPKGVYGLVFRNEGKTVIGIWAEEEQALEIPSTVEEAQLIDIMGNSTRIKAQEGVIRISAGVDPQYLVISGQLPEGAVRKDYRNSDSSRRTDFTPADRIILEQKYSEEAAADSKVNGYTLTDQTPNIVTVEVTNLNSEKMSGTILGKGYEGFLVTPAYQEVEIEAFGKQSLTFTITASDQVTINTNASIQFRGVFDGEETSNCVAQVHLPGEENPQIDELIPGSDQKEMWGININTSNNGICTITDGERKGAVTFANSFTGGDRWTYPVLTMPENTDFTGTKGLTFHVDAQQDFENGSVAVMRVLLTEENGSKYWTPDGFFLKEGEQQITIPWSAFSSMAGPADNNFHLDIDQITAIELGLNSRVDNAPVYSVWNFGTYMGSTKQVYPVIENFRITKEAEMKYGKLLAEAVIVEGSIPGKMDTLNVKLDGTEIKHEYLSDSNTIRLQADQVPEGTHKLTIQFFCEDGKGVLFSSFLEVQRTKEE